MDTTCQCDPVKIALCIPAYGSKIRVELVNPILRDFEYAGRAGHQLGFFSVDSQPVDRARNRAVKIAREKGFDFLYMIDADTWAEPTGSALEALMCSACEHDAAAVVAPVICRSGERVNVHPKIPGDVYEAEAAGAAMILIDLRKLAELEPAPGFAWFRFVLGSDGIDYTGEDIYFSQAIRKLGGRLICNYQIPTRHLADFPLRLEQFSVSGPKNPVGDEP